LDVNSLQIEKTVSPSSLAISIRFNCQQTALKNLARVVEEFA